MADQPTNNAEATKIYLSLMMEEYKALREAAKTLTTQRLLLLQIGGTLCAAVIGAAASHWDTPSGLAPVLLLVVVPLLASLSLVFWVSLAETFGDLRIYLHMIEQKADLLIQELGMPPCVVEKWPEQQRRLERVYHCWPGETILGPLGAEQWANKVATSKREASNARMRQLMFSAARIGFFPVLMGISLILGQLNLAVVPTPVFGRAWPLLVLIGVAMFATSVPIALMIMWGLKPPRPRRWPMPSPVVAPLDADPR